jgi:hypothetical protein
VIDAVEKRIILERAATMGATTRGLDLPEGL